MFKKVMAKLFQDHNPPSGGHDQGYAGKAQG